MHQKFDANESNFEIGNSGVMRVLTKFNSYSTAVPLKEALKFPNS